MTPAVLAEWIEERKDGGRMAGNMHMETADAENKNIHAGHGEQSMAKGSKNMAEQSHMNHEDHAHHMSMEKEVENGMGVTDHSQEAHHAAGHDHHMWPDNEEKNESPLPERQVDGNPISGHDHMNHMDMENEKMALSDDHAGHMQHGAGGHKMAHMSPNMWRDPHMFHMMEDRPMFATVTVAVCHCGAGCLLGDLVGEWLVFGTNAQINGRMMWPQYLIGTSPIFAFYTDGHLIREQTMPLLCFSASFSNTSRLRP